MVNMVDTKAANHRARGVAAQSRKRDAGEAFDEDLPCGSKYPNLTPGRAPKKRVQMLDSRGKGKHVEEDGPYVEPRE